MEQGQQDYHPSCARKFFGTEQAPQLLFALDEIEQLAKKTIELSVAVPGVQPKLSLGWLKSALNDGHQNKLTIMDALDGNYILKPPVKIYPQMPENEHLSMKLAALFGIDIVPVNMIRLASGELCFITKRIDRNNDGSKNHMIDFLQILELEDKYKGTMEKLGKRIGELSANTLLDKLRFFELTIFNYLIGNNDMHLKNFSMFLLPMGWVLSPAYDLLNVKMILPKDKEEMALLLGGKKFNFNRAYFTRFATSLRLNEKQVQTVYKRIDKWLSKAIELIDISFLSEERKIEYKNLITERVRL
ncbi:HipA domain-containing protein [Flavitalea sp.]|nr:HipA domain-containing protein [Flavitalea sp.]